MNQSVHGRRQMILNSNNFFATVSFHKTVKEPLGDDEKLLQHVEVHVFCSTNLY